MNKIEKYLNLTLETNFPYGNFTDAELTKDYKSYDCEAYLFVADDTTKYKNFTVEEIKNKSHFNTASEKVVSIKKDSSEN